MLGYGLLRFARNDGDPDLTRDAVANAVMAGLDPAIQVFCINVSWMAASRAATNQGERLIAVPSLSAIVAQRIAVFAP